MKLKKISYTVLIMILVSFLSTYLYISEENKRFNDRCPVVIKTDYGINPVAEYYKGILNENSEFIAYKEFSRYTNRFVTLIKNNDEYFLSISGTEFTRPLILTKKINKIEGASIFNENLSKKLTYEKSSGGLHPGCLLVGIKGIKKSISTGGTYNSIGDFSLIDEGTKNQVEKLYYNLNKLVSSKFEEEINTNRKKLSMKLESEWTSSNAITVTEDEISSFKKKLRWNPFFELNH